MAMATGASGVERASAPAAPASDGDHEQSAEGLITALWAMVARPGDEQIVVDGPDFTCVVTRKPRVEALHISPREGEVIRLVAKGLPNKAIARVLEISEHTVASHLRRVFAKLGCSTRAEVVASAARHGVLAGLGD